MDKIGCFLRMNINGWKKYYKNIKLDNFLVVYVNICEVESSFQNCGLYWGEKYSVIIMIMNIFVIGIMDWFRQDLIQLFQQNFCYYSWYCKISLLK